MSGSTVDPEAESRAERRKRSLAVARKLKALYPDSTCTLDYASPLELLVATILSAQCTDKRVNRITPALFARYPSAAAYAAADPEELQESIRTAGFFRSKAKNIKACCRTIVDEHAGQVPRTLEQLTALAGVARKTANVVLGDAFGVPGITVDTHVGRVSRRLALTTHADPVKVERDLMELVPKPQWTAWCHRTIDHGRQVCHARKPACADCGLKRWCPQVGVA